MNQKKNIQQQRRRTTRILLSMEMENLSVEFQRVNMAESQKDLVIRPSLNFLKDQNMLEVKLCEKDQNGNIIKVMQQPLIIKIFHLENPQYNWKISDVMIGSGVYGRVYKAFDQISKKEFALKIIEFKEFESTQFADLINEIFILKKLASRGLNQYFVELFDQYIITDDNYIYKKLVLVEELCQCNLNDIINFRREQKIEWREEELQGIFTHLLSALEKIQINGVCHRDLKPQNILFSSSNMQFKVGDFSEGKFLQEIEDVDEKDEKYQNLLKKIQKKRHTIRGTPLFMSPELKQVLQDNQQINFEYSPFHSDLYSIGITFLSMIQLSTKMNQGNIKQLMQSFTKSLNQNQHSLSKKLTENLIQENEEKRLTYQDTKQQIGDIKIKLSEDANIAKCIDNYKLEDKQTQAKIRLIIAEGYQKLCKFKEALEMYQKFMKDFSGYDQKDEQSEALYNMGKIYSISLQIEDAQKCFEDALHIRSKLFGNNSVQCGEIYSALGFLSKNQHEFKNAKQYYERALQIALTQQGESSASVGDIYNNLGSLEIQFGNYESSRNYLEKSESIIRQIFGEKSNQYNDILTNLAVLDINMKNFNSAKQKLIRTYEECSKLKGIDNPDLIIKLVNLAIIDTEEKKYNQSIERLQKASWIAEKYYKKKSLPYVEIINNLFYTYKEMGNYDRAFELVKQSQDILQSMSNNHPMLIYIYSNLADLFSKKKQFDKVVVALKNAKVCFDRNPIDIKVNADLCFNLAITLHTLGKWEESLKYFKDAKTIYEQKFSENKNIQIINERMQMITKNLSQYPQNFL